MEPGLNCTKTKLHGAKTARRYICTRAQNCLMERNCTEISLYSANGSFEHAYLMFWLNLFKKKLYLIELF